MKYILYFLCLTLQLSVQANNDIKHVFTDSYSNEKVTGIVQADASHYYIMAGGRLHSIDLGDSSAADKNVFMVIHLPVAKTPWVYLLYSLILAAAFRFAVIPYVLARKKRMSKPIKVVMKETPLSPEHVKEMTDREFVETVRNLIFDNLSKEKVTVDFLCKKLNMSRSTLNNHWGRIDNESVSNFITAIKMEKAKELLLSHRYRVGDVAELLKYSDTKSFSKAFKKYHGTCPQDMISGKV